MARTSIPGLVILLAGALSLGCGSAWSVVRQASPDPFVGQARFGVLPVDYATVRVGDKSEVGYLALLKEDRERSSYADEKAALEETFRRSLRTTAGKRGVTVVAADGPGEAPFLIRPSVAFLEPGPGKSRVELDVKIVGADGDVLDEIQLSHSTDTQVGGRLRLDGEALGVRVADYLQSRVGRVDRSSDAENPEPPLRAPSPEPGPAPPPVAPEPPRVELPPPPPPPPPPVAAKPGKASRALKPAAAVPKGKHPSAPPPPPGTPIASAPGFSRLEDGKSRVWVEVSTRVDVVETRAPGRVSYRLRGAAVLQPTDQLALDTGFFTTPVTRVQLVTQGADLDLIVDLREDFVPAYSMVDTPRGVVLQIDLPRSANFGRVQTPLPEPSEPAARRPRTTQKLGDPSAPAPSRPQGHRGRGAPTTTPGGS